MKKLVIALFAVILLFNIGFSKNSKIGQISVYDEIYTLKTLTSDSLTIQEVSRKSFKLDKNYTFFESFRDSTLWLKIPVYNATDKTKDYYFVLENGYLLSGDFWLEIDDVFVKGHHANYRNNLKTPRYSNYPTWKYTLSPGQKATIYFSIIDRETRTRKGFSILDENEFNSYKFSQIFGLSIYSILIILTSLFVATLSIARKQWYLLFYSGYLLFFLFDYGSLKGFYQTYIWPSSSYLINNGRSLSHLMISFLGSLFFWQFYKRRNIPKWIYRYFLLFALLLLPFLVAYLLKMVYDPFPELYIYLWTFININLFTVFILHVILSFKKVVPFYLAFSFSLPILGTLLRNSIVTNVNTPDLFILLHNNSYFITLIIELLFITYFIITEEYKRHALALASEKERVDKLQSEMDKQKTEIIELKSKAVLPVEEIISIKSDGHYLEFYLLNKERPEVDRNRMKEVLTMLPDKFIQIHKSYIVNIDHIRSRYATKVVLQNGKELPVSRTYRQGLEHALGK